MFVETPSSPSPRGDKRDFFERRCKGTAFFWNGKGEKGVSNRDGSKHPKIEPNRVGRNAVEIKLHVLILRFYSLLLRKTYFFEINRLRYKIFVVTLHRERHKYV